MKHKIRDLIIFWIDVLGITFVYRLYYRTKGPLVRVVCFHDVPNREWFESVIKMFVEEYQTITPQQFHAKEFHEKKINILLTFDDGYQSWIDNCLPILEKYQVKGLFFINSGLLDIAEDAEKVAVFMKERLLITPKKALTWDGAKKLIEAGHRIGGHTVDHINLAAASKEQIQQEIVKDKERIKGQLHTVVDFAIPFGTKKHFNGTALGVARASYVFVYTAIPAFYDPQDTGEIPRTLLENGQSLASVERRVTGAYDIFNVLKL